MILKKKRQFELSALMAWIALWIVNTYSKFQVNIFYNKRNITNCQSFSMTPMLPTIQKAIAIPRFFSAKTEKQPSQKLILVTSIFTSPINGFILPENLNSFYQSENECHMMF